MISARVVKASSRPGRCDVDHDAIAVLALPLAGRTVIVVDDGIATGSTVRAACRVARAHGAKRVVLAAPVGPARSIASLRRDADEVICPYTPDMFLAIGEYYADFSQTRDAEVTALLSKAGQRALAGWAPHRPATPTQPPDTATGRVPDPPAFEREITFQAGDARLPGHIIVPDQAPWTR